MPELPTPRSSKKRRLQNSLQIVSPPSVNRTTDTFSNLKVPQTPNKSPLQPHGSYHSNTSAASETTTNINSATDILATRIYDLFKQLDEFRDSLSKSYDAERKARQEAHEVRQSQLAGMQDLLLDIAADYTQVRRRERMGMVELGLFGANGVVSPKKREPSGELEDSMVDEAEEDVNMEDFDDSQSTELGLDETSAALGARVQRPMQVESKGEGEEEEEEEEVETEDDSLPVARARQRKHVSQTISPTIPPRHLHEGSTTESDTPAEDESETISVRALKRSLQLGTRVKKTQTLGQQRQNTADLRNEGIRRHGARQQEGSNTSQIFSQYSVPPDPEEEDDETYRESPITTPEREVQPVEQQVWEMSEELEYGLSSPRKQRPHREKAQVENYYAWERYVTGGPVPVASTPAQNKDKVRENVNASSPKKARRGGRSSDSSPGLEILESRVVGGKSKHGKRQSVEIGDSSGEVIVVKSRRL